MIHQWLFECGEDPAHASAGWRREIMGLHELIISGLADQRPRGSTARSSASTKPPLTARYP
jgi:hypothetical protein